MHSATLRKVGGSVMVAIPPVVLSELDMKAGEDVRVEVEGANVIIKPVPRKGWTLAALLAASDYETPVTDAERQWFDALRVGGELI